MTSNNIILAQPESGATLSNEISTDTSGRLNFGSEEIFSLQLGDAGELVILFIDGGQLNITNFEDFIDNGNLLYLSDGTLIDPSILTNSPRSPEEFNIADAMNADAIQITQPAANTTQEIAMQSGQKYVCDFDPANAVTVDIKDGQMVLIFADGSQVVISNYSEVMAGELPPVLTLADGTVVDSDELLTGVTEIEAPGEEILKVAEAQKEPEAEQVANQVANIEPAGGESLDSVAEALAQIEPAAGDGAVGNTGYGFSSTPSSAPLNSPDAIGPLGPTQLAYNAPQVQGDNPFIQAVTDDRPVISSAEESLDETNLLAGNLVASGTLNVSYGNDGPGSILPNGMVTPGGSLANNVLSSSGVPVVFTQTIDGYIGEANGVTVFTFEIDSVSGEYTYTQILPFDNADTTNDNDVITVDFGVVAIDADGDRTTANVRIYVADDAPVVTSQIAKTVDETNLDGGPLTTTGQFFTDPGEDAPATYAGTDTFSATGSVAGGTLASNGVPVVVTFDVGTNTYTGVAGTTTIFTMVIDPTTGAFTYTQSAPIDHADGTDPNDEITLNFGASVTDSDGDTATGTLIVKVLDDGPEIASTLGTVDETDLPGPVIVNGTVTGDFGEDGAGEYGGTGIFASSGSQLGGTLTHNGVPVTVTYDAATGTYTGVAGTDTIFTTVINDDGTYTFTLLSTLDHADPNNPNDIINLDFGVEITDYDGDSATDIIRIHVKDDVPTIGDSSGDVDETNFDSGPLTYIDTAVHNFGLELGSINADGITSSSTPLLSDGVPVTIAQVGNTYTGTAGGVTVFTLVIDSTTGEYTYTQLEPLDHPDATDPDDVISINFGIEIESLDGSTDSGTITINVADDGPLAVDDITGAEESQVITGDVVANDEPSEDNPNTVTNVQFNGTDYAVPVGGSVTITTPLGELVMNSDGTYEYTAANNDPDGTDVFTYTLTDNDDDSDTADLSVRVTPDGEPVRVSKLLAVDETNLTPGPMIFNGDLDIDFGIDGAGTVTGNDSFAAGGSLLGGTLTSSGVPVVVAFDAGTNTYTGTAGTTTVFTVVVNSDGTYSFQLFDHIDHADATDPNDIITLEFGITAEDADGDTTDGTFTIHVHDDAPVAIDDITSAEESQVITGDVVANDEPSEDNPNTVTNVEFNGTDYAVPAGGSVTITTPLGELVMNSDGTYEYTAANNDPDGTDVFTYTLTDYDGDSDTAELSVTVTPDGTPVAVDKTLAVDETNLTPGPMIFNGDLDVDFGLDGPGTVTANGSFTAGGSLAGGTLTSSGVPVVVTLAGDTYTGKVGTTTIFTVKVNNDGTYSFQLFDHIDHADATDPNDIITLEFGVTATDPDGDSAEGTFTVLVHDDAPVAIDDGTTNVDESQTVTGNVTTNDELSEDNPTPVVDVIFNGVTTAVPAVSSVNVVGLYGTLTISADGTYSYTANSNDPDGTDTFTYVLQDYDGDRETAEINFKVEPDVQPIITPPAVEVVDDTSLSGGPNVATGTIVVDYGVDDPGEVNPNNIFSSSEQNLSSCGNPITVTLSGNTYTGVANGATVFTMTILENGNYTFTQFKAIDHPNTNDHNEALTLNFGATATDSDGDTAATTLQVRVLDDGPDIGQIAQQVDEGVLANGNLVATGTVPNDFGEDGPGAITTNGLFEAKFAPTGSNVTLTSGGNAVTVTNTSGVYTGTANGQTVFTLSIDPANGNYTYRQFAPIDHPDATDPDDVIWLKFYVDITDCDGDHDTGIIIIDVHDDGPQAVDDTGSVSGTGTTASGNVLTNDDAGADDGSVVVTTPGTYVGNFGTLVLNANGTYTYTRKGQAGGTDRFNYTMRDADGDTDTATLSVSVAADHSPISISGSGATDDTALASGPDVETGTISVNYQGDGPGTTTANGAFSTSGYNTGGALSYQGTNINVTQSGNSYIGKAGSVTVFTMTINANGTYKFTQYQELDHSLTTNNNEPIYLKFGVRATDADGDTGNGTVTITVRDDAPNAVNDSLRVTGDKGTGNVLVNDTPGQDSGAEVVTRFNVDGTWYNAGQTASTSLGTIRVNANGTYTVDRPAATSGTSTSTRTFTETTQQGFGRDSWTQTATVRETTTTTTTSVPGGTLRVTYEMRDYDGDRDTAVLDLNLVPSSTSSKSVSRTETPVGGDGGGDGDGTPLVVDLDGDGIELLSKENGVSFDMDLDGIKDQTGWVDADDGLLALDKNGDGIINDRSELFGDTDGHSDGFDNLSSYDSNGDGVIDANDDIYDDLRVWQDLNSDGISDTNELLTLEQIGIVSISLNASVSKDIVIEGNSIILTSTYLTSDGEERDIVDAIFQYDSGIDDAISATTEADNFIFQAIQDSAVEIRNFDATEDTVDLSALIQGQDNITDAINDFVYVTEIDGSTIISIDADGANGPAEAVEVAKLDGISGASVEELVDSGTIVI